MYQQPETNGKYGTSIGIIGGESGQRPQSTLESAVGNVHNGIGALQQAIEILTERLQGVLAPSVPRPQTADSIGSRLNQVDTPHSPTINDLFTMRSRLETLTAAVNEIVGRLET